MEKKLLNNEEIDIKEQVKELFKNPDIIKVIGVKNIQALIRLRKKIEDAIDDPEFMIREFKVENKVWIGFLFRKIDKEVIQKDANTH